jgi:hypothetical protein
MNYKNNFDDIPLEILYENLNNIELIKLCSVNKRLLLNFIKNYKKIYTNIPNIPSRLCNNQEYNDYITDTKINYLLKKFNIIIDENTSENIIIILNQLLYKTIPTNMIKESELLTSLNASIKIIDNNDFNRKKLKSIIIPNTVTHIGFDTFSYNLMKILLIPKSVNFIGNSAFYNNNIEIINIQNNINYIGSYAFSVNKIRSLIIPNSVTLISPYAFQNNKIKILKFSSNIDRINNFKGNSIKATQFTSR